MVHGLKSRSACAAVTWDETNSGGIEARIFPTKAHFEYHRKTIHVISAGNTGADIFHACIHSL